MEHMRIGIAQLNTTVGDLAGNRRKILDAYATLVDQGAELVVYPELVVCGYPPRDLLFKTCFVPDTEKSLDAIAAAIREVPALIGTVTRNPAPHGRPFRNAAAFCQRGKILHTAHKCLLPTYDVFDEDRYFEPASAPLLLIDHAGHRIGVTICEDIWTRPALRTRPLYRIDPVMLLSSQKPDLMLNLSASPWQQEKASTRVQLVADTARALRAPVVYCNAIGGNDELVF
ncbi:MAG: NAD+ synthase, partial [Opitutaceae bacterium]|nr:NAD+ synthase [Opitutaceae bacterium]